MPSPLRIVVAGGGAAGIFAAIAAAENNPNCQVTVLEKGREILTKVKISGGGRCNVTHSCFEPNELVKSYPRGSRELRGPFHHWGAGDTVDWFESRGVKLKTESDNRIFPTTDSSQTIINCLTDAASEAGVKIMKGYGMIDAQAKPDGAGFWITITGEETIECEKLLIASGSLSQSKSRNIALKLGHTIEPLVPSLFTFHIKDSRLNNLAGLSVAEVEATVPETDLKSIGPMLITHWGLSGPAVLRLSAWGARILNDKAYKFPVRINWVPQYGGGKIGQAIEEAKKKNPRRRVKSGSNFPIPQRLWEKLIVAADIAEDTVWATLSKDKTRALANQLGHSQFDVIRKSMNKEEFVTCGGISLKEINFKTMESKVCPALYFAGESLNIDGITGGFNFQAAWTTGMLAGRAMATEEA